MFHRISGVEKNLRKRREGGGRQYHGVLSKIFCLRIPENVVEELACTLFQKNSGSERKIWIRVEGGGKDYQDFPSLLFCLIVPENFVGESFSVSLIPISKKLGI